MTEEQMKQWYARRETEDSLADEMEADAQAAMYDDDPNPYHGDYSEE